MALFPRPVAPAALAALVALTGCGEPEPLPPITPGPVFLLGFDGLAPPLVERWEAEGLLPNFARLREEGAVGNVRSTVPMISPPAWTTVATGVTPTGHGIWSFWLPDGDDPRGRFVDATARLAPAIWQDLSASGHTVGVVNVPITCPPDSVNGFLVAGFPYPEDAPLTWPPRLEEEITAQGYLRDAWLGPPRPGEELDWLHRMREIGEARRRVALTRLLDESPDLSFIVFTTPDRIQHHLWRFHDPRHPLYREDAPDELKNAIRDAYVWCDDILGQVLEALPRDATLFVLSDHGFGPAYAGISKGRVMAQAAPEGRAAATRNLFGGDFWLGGASEAERDGFVRKLEAMRGPGGSPLVGAVHDTRATPYPGYGLELGPEIVAEEAEGFLFVPGPDDGPLTGPLAPTAFSGWHRRLGYFAALGHPIVPGPVRDLDLRDVPAMTLHVLGEPIPRRFTHNVPRRLFPDTYFVERPMRFSLGPREGFRRPGERPAARLDPDVEEQLEALGYVQQ
jgi:hypothetical protein